MASLNCTLNGIRYNNAAGTYTNWSNFSYVTSGSAYAGWAGATGVDCATVFKITVPSFSGISSSININLKIQNQVDNGGPTTLSWALAKTDANITGNKYADGSTYPLTGNGEIANGTFSFNIRNASYQSYTFTINTSAITTGGTYYLILYRYNNTGISFQYPSSITLSYANTYTVSYNANGGSSTPASQTKVAGTDLKLSGAISRSNTTASVKTTFDANGGSVSPASSSSTVTTKYTFNGWKASNGTVYAASANYTTDATTTMTAQWTSSVSGASVTLPTPTRAGHTFAGWYTAASGGSKVTTHKPTSNSTLYAHWTANSYTVSYDANGGTGSMTADTVTYGQEYKTKKNTITRIGYTFKGWNEKADGTGTVWDATTSGTYENGTAWRWTYTKNITLYAQWTPNEIVFNYYGNNGTSTKFVTWTAKASQSWPDHHWYYTSGTYKQTAPTGYSATGYYGTTTTGGTLVSQDRSFTSYADLCSVYGVNTQTASTTINIYAQWSINYYPLTITGIGSLGSVDVYINGSLSASNVTSYSKEHPYGTTFEIKNIKVSTGYTYNGVTSGLLSGTITADTNIALSFSRTAYTLSISNDANTSVYVKRNNLILTSNDVIYYGDVLTITFTANSGSSIQTHTVNGVAFTSGGTHTVTGNVTIIVSAISNIYALTLNQGAGTSITVKRNGSVLLHGASIAYGDVLTISIVANTGYQLATTSHANGSSITVTGNVAISATASVLSYKLSISSGQNTSISVQRTSSPVANAPIGLLSSGATIYHFDLLKIDFYAADGYTIGTSTVNGNSFTSGNSYYVYSNVTVASTAIVETVARLVATINNGTASEIAIGYIWDGSSWVLSDPHVLLK